MAAACVAVLLLSTPVDAQWLKQPSAGAPRKADGTADLAAAAPRTSENRPDLSGIWYLEATGCGSFGCGDYVAGPEFLNFDARVPGGLPYQPWAAELVKQRTAEFSRDDPVALCRPGGVFRFLTFPPPRKFVQLPGLFLILSERDVTYRQIFTDGRALPADPEPTWNGYSVGRWENDVLVVETIGLRDGTWIDRAGSPLTAAAKLTERFRRLSYGRAEVTVTLDDAKAYTKPWSVTLPYVLAPDTELLDYHCTDNEKTGGAR
jgi:hypothetical protein